jgi:glycosyltransferase involved in cell wall biosynthesis
VDYVSIIIPTHNRAQFIERSVESCINQKNVITEIIVVDDNGLGTMNQVLVENKLKKLIDTKQIIYIAHQFNQGGSSARNTGINSASGEFIAFLDDDDWFEPDKLFKQIEKMKQEKSEVCLCGFTRNYKNKNVTSIPDITKFNAVNLLGFNLDTCAGSCLLIRKSLIKYVGLFDTSFIRHQDLEYLYRIYKKSKISIVNESLSNIYMHNNNLKVVPAKKIEQHVMHYINTFIEDIQKFDKPDRCFILDRHYLGIAKAYIKNKKFISSIKWILKTSNPLKTINNIRTDIKNYLNTKREPNDV